MSNIGGIKNWYIWCFLIFNRHWEAPHWGMKCINFSSFQIWNWNSQKSDQYSLFDEVSLLVALTKGLASTFSKIHTKFDSSFKIIRQFLLTLVWVLGSSQLLIFTLWLFFKLLMSQSFWKIFQIGKPSPKENLENFTGVGWSRSASIYYLSCKLKSLLRMIEKVLIKLLVDI